MTWNVSDLLKREERQAILEELEKKVNQFANRDITTPDPEDVKDMIEQTEEISELQTRLYAHTYLQHAVDVTDSEHNAKLKELESRFTEHANKLRFFTHWFKNLEEEEAQTYIESDTLQTYRYYLEKLRKDKPYTQSEEVEEAITYKDDAVRGLSKVYDLITTNYEYEWDGETITRDELLKKTKDENPETRKKAYETLLQKYDDYSDVLTEIYRNIVTDWINEGLKIRNYQSPIHIRNHGNDVQNESVESLLDVTQDNTDIIQEYFELKKEINNAKGATYDNERYHVYAPYEGKPEKEYTYEESQDIILNVFKKFHDDMYKAAKKVMDKDHIHPYPKKGKQGGAFCYPASPDHTPYVFLNHTDDLNSLFTFIHECGHAVHGELQRKQTHKNYGTPTTLAETASVFAEKLLQNHLLKKSDDKDEKIAILMNQLDNYYSTIFRQIYFTIFEKYAHNAIQDGKTKDDLQDKYMQYLSEQFGTMDIPDIFKHEWNYIPHIHHSPFYCYSYGWGNLSTLALYKKYEEEGERFAHKYIKLLESGNKESTETLLKDVMNFDVSKKTFWEEGFRTIRDDLETLRSLTAHLR